MGLSDFGRRRAGDGSRKAGNSKEPLASTLRVALTSVPRESPLAPAGFLNGVVKTQETVLAPLAAVRVDCDAPARRSIAPRL
jgi:hypothetical protein